MAASASDRKASVGIGLVGCGFSASFHVENYKRVHGVDVRIVGVHSRRRDAATEFASAHGIERVYDSMEHLLGDPDVDLVDACVPNAFHEQVVVQALGAGKHVAVEKPFTGYFTPGSDSEGWQRCLDEAVASADRMIEAERRSGRHILYAENWVHAPGVQKARRLLEAADTRILRMVAEECHSGTHSRYAMQWRTSGGGSLLNKGCHPLGGAIYLKYMEGMRGLGRPIRPSWVIGAVANLTHSEAFESQQSNVIRTGWTDCEDWGLMIVGFDDGTLAQIGGSDTVVGGIQNLMNVYATGAAIQININPNNAVMSYAPNAEAFEEEYIREKVETKAGWQYTNPDEDWMNGFPHEMQDFCEVAATGRKPLSGSMLGRDVTAVCYSAYLSAAMDSRRVTVPVI